MTDPDLRIHTLTGEVEVLPASAPPGAATGTVDPPSPAEQTLPIRPIGSGLAPWQALRAQWRDGTPGLRAAVLVLVAALAVLVVRDTENATTAGSVIAAEPTTDPSAVSVKPSVTPVGTPAVEDLTGPRPAPMSIRQWEALSEASLTEPIADAPADPQPSATPGTEVLHPAKPTAVYAAPGGPAIARLPVTLLGAWVWVPVVDRRPGWAMVLLPNKVKVGEPSPAGWVHLTATIELGHLDRYVRIDGRSGTISVVAALDDNPGPAGAPPGADSGRRTFMALTPAGRPTHWPAAVWWPLLVRAERLCPAVAAGIVIPGLRDDSLRDRLDSTGCLTAPAALWPILRDLPAGTVVLVR